jgi:hypothetical protein
MKIHKTPGIYFQEISNSDKNHDSIPPNGVYMSRVSGKNAKESKRASENKFTTIVIRWGGK